VMEALGEAQVAAAAVLVVVEADHHKI